MAKGFPPRGVQAPQWLKWSPFSGYPYKGSKSEAMVKGQLSEDVAECGQHLKINGRCRFMCADYRKAVGIDG